MHQHPHTRRWRNLSKAMMLTMATVITASATLHSNVADARTRKKPKNPKPPVTAPPPVEPAAPDTAPTTDAAVTETSPTSTGTPTSAPAASAVPATGPANPATAPVATTDVRSDVAVATVDELRQEYLALRDELFASRARAAAVSSQLFSTKVIIRFRFDAGRYYSVPKASIRLDGASVFEDTQGAIGADDAVRFTGFVAPGHHVVTFRVETIGKDDDRFSSANEAQVSVEAVAGKDLLVVARAKDAGDIPYAWKRSERGDYGLSMSVAVKTEKNGSAAVATPAVGKDARATK